MNNYTYITLCERPELKARAAEWFNSKWGVPTQAYISYMDDYLARKTEYGWYLCMDGDNIVGGLGVIANDFHDRKDLTPEYLRRLHGKRTSGQGHSGQAAQQRR